MQPFQTIKTSVVPLDQDNIDTDQIIPAGFLKTTTKKGLGEHLFESWRYTPDGSPNPNFILNKPDLQDAKILLVRANFGCGSSREHAPWALMDYGFRVIIASSFADIFKNNSYKNGLLLIELTKEEIEQLFKILEANPTEQFSIDLEQQSVTIEDNTSYQFDIPTFRKKCILQGMDDLDYIFSHEDKIKEYEEKTPVKGFK